jgi:transglutaminase/protease-like cytokinesis protein 3
MDKKTLLALIFVSPLLFLPFVTADSSEAGTEDFFSYYSQLDDEEKAVYDAIANSPSSENGWSVTLVAEADADSVKHAVAAAYLDDPGKIWLLKVPADLVGSYVYDPSARTVTFSLPDGVSDSYEQSMADFAGSIGIQADTSVSEAMRLIDLRLRSSAVYTEDTDNPLYYTAYGAMVLGKANSFGFAAAVKYCAENSATYDVAIVCGTLNDPDGSYPHSWNAVRDSEGWYGVDVGLNEKKDTSHYLMKASNDHGYNTDYTFAASHDPDISGFMETGSVIKSPELYIRPTEVPVEPTFLDKYGGDIVIISIIAILCVALAFFARRQ